MSYELWKRLNKASKKGGAPEFIPSDPADYLAAPAGTPTYLQRPQPQAPMAIGAQRLPAVVPETPQTDGEIRPDAVARGVEAMQQRRGVSPQMQSNLDQRDAQLRFAAGRRMEGRPGIPYGPFMVGGAAPISAQKAAGFVSDKLGSDYQAELDRLRPLEDMGTVADREKAALELETGKYELSRAKTEAEMSDEERRIRMEQGGEKFGMEVERFEREGETIEFERQYAQKLNNLQIRRDELQIEINERDLSEEPLTPRQSKMIDILDTQIITLSEGMQAAYAEGDFITADSIQDEIDELTEKQMRIIQGATTAMPDLTFQEGERQLTAGQEQKRRSFEQVRAADSADGIARSTGLDRTVEMLADIADESPDNETVSKMRDFNESLRKALAAAEGDEAVKDQIRLLVKQNAGFYKAERAGTQTGEMTAAKTWGRILWSIPGPIGWWLAYKGILNTRRLRAEVKEFQKLMAGGAE